MARVSSSGGEILGRVPHNDAPRIPEAGTEGLWPGLWPARKDALHATDLRVRSRAFERQWSWKLRAVSSVERELSKLESTASARPC